MVKIVNVKKSIVLELNDEESRALFGLLETISTQHVYQYGHFMPKLEDLQEELRPYYEELPF